MLADHLQRVQASEGVVLPWRSPQENIREAASCLTRSSPADASCAELAEHFSQLVRTMLDHGHNLHDPRYIGHQVPAPVPLGGLFDAVGSLTNQVMAIYDMGPWSTSVECAMVEELGRRIGWPSGQFSGLVTHGGSIANLTALLTARNVRLPGLLGARCTPWRICHRCWWCKPMRITAYRDRQESSDWDRPGHARGAGRSTADGPAATRRLPPAAESEKPADRGSCRLCLCYADRRI